MNNRSHPSITALILARIADGATSPTDRCWRATVIVLVYCPAASSSSASSCTSAMLGPHFWLPRILDHSIQAFSPASAIEHPAPLPCTGCPVSVQRDTSSSLHSPSKSESPSSTSSKSIATVIKAFNLPRSCFAQYARNGGHTGDGVWQDDGLRLSFYGIDSHCLGSFSVGLWLGPASGDHPVADPLSSGLPR
jgi:hypothetical protein